MFATCKLAKYRTKWIGDEYYGPWFERYWYIIVIAVSVIATLLIMYGIYKHQKRSHNIVLYVGKESSTVAVQHRKTFSAHVPDVDGEFCGWYRDSAFTIPFNSSDKIVRDISLYAKIK